MALPVEDVRRMTAMWADGARRQIIAFEDSVDRLRQTEADRQFRLAYESGERSEEWVHAYEAATQRITQRESWSVGIERYYLLLTLAQLRKCVLRLPEEDGVTNLRESKTIRLLRDIDEHWEQGEGLRSLDEMREWRPDVLSAPGAFSFNGKYVWFGDVSLDEIAGWVEAVDSAVRLSASDHGDDIPKPEEPLPDHR